MKRRCLHAEGLICLAMHPEQRRDGYRHLIGAAARIATVGADAAALAALTVEPILAKSIAAAVKNSGAAITNDI